MDSPYSGTGNAAHVEHPCLKANLLSCGLGASGSKAAEMGGWQVVRGREQGLTSLFLKQCWKWGQFPQFSRSLEYFSAFLNMDKFWLCPLQTEWADDEEDETARRVGSPSPRAVYLHCWHLSCFRGWWQTLCAAELLHDPLSLHGFVGHDVGALEWMAGTPVCEERNEASHNYGSIEDLLNCFSSSVGLQNDN